MECTKYNKVSSGQKLDNTPGQNKEKFYVDLT